MTFLVLGKDQNKPLQIEYNAIGTLVFRQNYNFVVLGRRGSATTQEYKTKHSRLLGNVLIDGNNTMLMYDINVD